jgi:phosphoglycolate phosphatase
LLLACKQLDVLPHNAIYVGDHVRDIQAGKSAGLKTIAADYGYIEADDAAANWSADFIAQSAGDIYEYLQALI